MGGTCHRFAVAAVLLRIEIAARPRVGRQPIG
jgi:hypothetical protein